MNKYWIADNIYRQHFEIIANCSYPEFIKHTKKAAGLTDEASEAIGDNDLEKTTLGAEFKTVQKYKKDGSIIGRYNFLWLKSFDWTIRDVGILGHEVVHLTHTTLIDTKIPLNEDTSEAYAYYYEYIFNKCLNKLYKSKKCTKMSSKKKSKKA